MGSGGVAHEPLSGFGDGSETDDSPAFDDLSTFAEVIKLDCSISSSSGNEPGDSVSSFIVCSYRLACAIPVQRFN